MNEDNVSLGQSQVGGFEAQTFFDKYPRFEQTSTVASDIKRLNYRYAHVIERNRDILEGKRVLDVASHDARFTLAALAGAGAKHVTGIEARASLVAHAIENLKYYGIAEDRFDLITGDVFEKIGTIPAGSIDTAMVLGFLYHTARQYELISAISSLGVSSIIIDSNVVPKAERPIILLRWEGTQDDAQIWDADRKKVLSSTPSLLALSMLLEEFGYTPEILEPLQPIPKSALQYPRGQRVTLVGRKR